MVQLGYNAGPRHARVWGLAKSFSRILPEDTKTQRDRDAVATLSMAWAVLRTHLPREGIDAMEKAIEDVEMPRLATRSVEEGVFSHTLVAPYSFLTRAQAMDTNS